MATLTRHHVMQVLDLLVGYFILMPLVVLFWHSTWNMFEPQEMTPTFAWLELGIGVIIELCLAFFQGPLRNLLHRPHSAFTHVVTTRAYNYALGTVNILHNKGLADLYFLYIGDDTMSALQTAVMTTILLGSLRVTRNILGVPFYVDVDCNVEDYFQTDPYFSSTANLSFFGLLDHAITLVIVHTLVHMHWIGMGGVLEALLFPNDPTTALVVNLMLGYATCSILIACQSQIVATSARLETNNKSLQLLFEDIVIVAANTASIFLWNGMWAMFDNSFNPEETSYLLVQVVTFVFLVLAHATPNVIGKGCDIDGRATSGDGVQFVTDYVGAIIAGHGTGQAESDKDK